MSKLSSEVQTAKTPCVPMPWLRLQHMRCHTPSFISEETAWCLEESGKNIRRISRVTNHQSSSSKKQHEYHIARTFVIASPSTVLSSCRSGSSVACDAFFWPSTARFLLAQTHLARFGACAFGTQWSLHAVCCTLRDLSWEDLHFTLSHACAAKPPQREEHRLQRVEWRICIEGSEQSVENFKRTGARCGAPEEPFDERHGDAARSHWRSSLQAIASSSCGCFTSRVRTATERSHVSIALRIHLLGVIYPWAKGRSF